MNAIANKQLSSWDILKALTFFRIAIGSFALLQMSLLLPAIEDLLGPSGWVQWEITQAMNPLWKIHLADFCTLFHVADDRQTVVLYTFVACYMTSALGLTLGFFTQVNALLLTFFHAVFLKVITPFIYGADISLHFALFYLIFFPSNTYYALDIKWGIGLKIPSVHPKFALRVLQIHLCMLYYSAGFEKIRQPDWWNGNAIYYALTHPDFGGLHLRWMSSFRLIPITLGILTVLLEGLYAIAMWIPYVRVFFLTGICLLHLGIMLFLHLYLFGWIMIVLSLSAWGIYALYDVKKWLAKTRLKNAVETRLAPEVGACVA
ncbi:hypothetical protein GCM10023231_19920 [Olivibacter ginsenosidimutans]|uniref:HTTM-like domain-containing protein n=1 Tax=Olivibacter ginsenosidimutans TaxID=1176537 RepID=A0ABP9B819_9SPHI